MARKMIEGGVDLIQLRAKARSAAEIVKIADALHELTRTYHIPLLINDHPEIARAVSAEGVHVGQEDISIEEARKIVGPSCIAGKSTHSFDQAIRAVAEGADYIGYGPIFATPTKPDYPPVGLDGIAKVHEAVGLPIFCIGGITLLNLPDVIAAGARKVVIVSGLLQSKDPAATARAAKQLLSAQAPIENRKPKI